MKICIMCEKEFKPYRDNTITCTDCFYEYRREYHKKHYMKKTARDDKPKWYEVKQEKVKMYISDGANIIGYKLKDSSQP